MVVPRVRTLSRLRISFKSLASGLAESWHPFIDRTRLTGVGDLTQLNIPAGALRKMVRRESTAAFFKLILCIGNPIGGLVFSSAFGALQQLHEWTVGLSASRYSKVKI
jgi:hypothetical protein